jgi:hypothetical protein
VRNCDLTRALLTRACQLALSVAFVVVLVIFYALWSTSATLMTSTNQHQRLAIYYLAGAKHYLLFCYVFARIWAL